MAQRVYDRVPDDRYETPDHITATIIPYLCSRALRIWEPAHAPADKLGNALRAAGFRVTSTAGDFLQCHDRPDVEALVTNPPYGKQGKLAEGFIAHALDLKVPHVALLLPVDFDSALTRAPLFGDCPMFAGKIVLRRRIKWFPGESGPSTNHAWFLWDQAHRGLPVLRYATPTRADRDHASDGARCGVLSDADLIDMAALIKGQEQRT
jgi:hypothetical protein